ncbi:SDR family NAD(P)-dependent oxidoreductase [Nocardia uniformis]|uniref:SDR family NAD(P)-dependent oxidoreductase n=1 Tax=Nocardia uniformis TaxID=53432 RepID=A0A849C8L1_9NOCA|nr:SDR family NAD(P)-dependent oxidoreductase [Nocardia uniformis]NNH71199.1 SDR family NAD(P)-dependent oxidoreductase [Nocardia uniformis]
MARLTINALTPPRGFPRPWGPGLRERVDGRTVLITGASSGIGRGLALRVAAAGAITLVTARRASELAELVEEIRATGGQAFALVADLSTDDGIDRLADEVLAEFGAPDILVNNAGRSIRRSIANSERRLHDYERTMRTNYLGAVGLMLRMLPPMRRRGSGQVITSSSIGVVSDLPRFSAYIGSKAALEAVVRVAAVECLSDGVVFTNVHIPLVDTDMIGPTGWSGYKALPIEDAVEMMVDAIVRRPEHLENPLGTAALWMTRLTPGLARRGLHHFHRMMPDSVAAKVAVTANLHRDKEAEL